MLESNRIYLGDCIDVMQLIDDKSIDLILCDLPYGETQNPDDVIIPFDKLWAQYTRIIKDNGAIVLFACGGFMLALCQSNRKMWRYNLVWDKILKTGHLNANRMPLRQHEDICVFYKKLPTYNPQFEEGPPLHSKGHSYLTKPVKNQNYGKYEVTDDSRAGSTQKYPASIIRFQKPHPSKARHATEKPVELLRYLIRMYSNEGDLVLDNCCGSGTTCEAAVLENRRFVGIEKKEENYEISVKRMAARLPAAAD